MYEHKDHNVQNLTEVTQLDLETHTQSMQNSRREKYDNEHSKDQSHLKSTLVNNRLYSNFAETRVFNLK